jgi:hypothetical protein
MQITNSPPTFIGTKLKEKTRDNLYLRIEIEIILAFSSKHLSTYSSLIVSGEKNYALTTDSFGRQNP